MIQRNGDRLRLSESGRYLRRLQAGHSMGRMIVLMMAAYPCFSQACADDRQDCQNEQQPIATDRDRVVAACTRLAEQGDAGAQWLVVHFYRDGHGVMQDYGKAVLWFRRAADQGNPSAETDLGVLYQKGLGVSQNNVEALKWYKRAAQQGDSIAQFNLGFIYHSGQGVRQD